MMLVKRDDEACEIEFHHTEVSRAAIRIDARMTVPLYGSEIVQLSGEYPRTAADHANVLCAIERIKNALSDYWAKPSKPRRQPPPPVVVVDGVTYERRF